MLAGTIGIITDAFDNVWTSNAILQIVINGMARKKRAFCITYTVLSSVLARISQCAPTARFTSGGRIHPGSCR